MVENTIPIEFPNAQGERLAARLELPSREPAAYSLFAHCFTCSKDIAAASRISRGLRRRGIAVLRFDFTGLGSSEGDFSNTNFSSNVQDLEAAAAWLREHHAAPRMLVGHSLGGAAVLVAASRLAEVEVVATIAAPSAPQHLKRILPADLSTLEAAGEITVNLAGREFKIKRQFLDDLERQDLTRDVGSLGKALIVFHSPDDELVEFAHAQRIFDAASHPKSFVSLDGADHLLTNRADSEFLARALETLSCRYLQIPDEEEARPGVPRRTILVEESGEPYTQRIRTGGHALTADEPRESGGQDLGPDPYELLLASLGACTSMTVRMYANHKKWPLDRIAVRLSHEKIHAKDCADCESKAGKVDRIEREVEVVGNLTEEQHARLMDIADRCPVHRTLTEGEVKVDTRTPLAG
jgi:putative redox protein